MITRRKFIAGGAAVAAGSAIAGPVGFSLPSGFSDPRSISGLKLWLDASQIVGLNDGDAVGTWADLSGNGNDAVQATGSKKPLYKTSIQNGRSAVQADGVDDSLYCSALVASHPFTIYFVSKAISTPAVTDAYFICDGDTTGTRRNVASYGDGALQQTKMGMFDGGVAQLFSSSSVTTIWNLVSWVQNGASTKVHINGILEVSGDTGSQAINGLTIFSAYSGGYSLNGYLCEFIVYEGAHSDASRVLVQNYLNAKWAIY